jgi:hypothetical protein
VYFVPVTLFSFEKLDETKTENPAVALYFVGIALTACKLRTGENRIPAMVSINLCHPYIIYFIANQMTVWVRLKGDQRLRASSLTLRHPHPHFDEDTFGYLNVGRKKHVARKNIQSEKGGTKREQTRE